MIRALAFTAALLAAPSALAQQAVTLQPNPDAAGATVTLGDIFFDSGEAASVEVARAPAPGQTITLESAWLKAFAAQHGLSWANAFGEDIIRIGRESKRIEADEIEQLITDELAMEADAPRFQISFIQRDLTMHAPADSAGAAHVTRFDYDARSHAFSAEIAAYDGADPVRISGRAYGLMEVPALTAPLARGEIIDAADIGWVEVRADRLRPDAILEASDLIGMQAKRALRPNEALRAYDVKQVAAIEKGALITVVFQQSGLTLTVQARALEEAATGESLRVVNLQSNRTIEAVASGPGKAVVGPQRFQTAAIN